MAKLPERGKDIYFTSKTNTLSLWKGIADKYLPKLPV